MLKLTVKTVSASASKACRTFLAMARFNLHNSISWCGISGGDGQCSGGAFGALLVFDSSVCVHPVDGQVFQFVEILHFDLIILHVAICG